MKKKNQNFLSENFHVLVVKFSVYLNKQVFVMYRFSERDNEKKMQCTLYIKRKSKQTETSTA